MVVAPVVAISCVGLAIAVTGSPNVTAIVVAPPPPGEVCGVTRDASGARSVSGALPMPVVGRAVAMPGTNRGATTSGTASSHVPLRYQASVS